MAYRDRPADGENPSENQGQVDREAGRHDLKKHSHMVSSVIGTGNLQEST